MHLTFGMAFFARCARWRACAIGCVVMVGALLMVGCGQTDPTALSPTLAPSVGATHTASPSPTAPPIATQTSTPTVTPSPTATRTPTPTPTLTHPLMVEVMRQQTYPASEVEVEEELAPGVNYRRYIASYRSEGLKILALLAVPEGPKPPSGWPVVVFNHGYIPPDQYRTAQRYVAYVDYFARSGYIVFASDYRGHGDSEGEPASSYASPDYTVDVLNALAAMRAYPDADPQRLGMWGHSMGGGITLRAMVVAGDIRAGVIWAGMVAPYPELLDWWRRRMGDASSLTPDLNPTRRSWRQEMLEAYGTPEENPAFWASISPNSYLADLSGPLQLQHGTADESVPLDYSLDLYASLQEEGLPAELLLYEGDDHNISQNLFLALQRSLEFFDAHVKGAEN